ncbi:MAG: DNA-directed RNA polymerase subunit B, partial [Promethearchaeota archaeon]
DLGVIPINEVKNVRGDKVKVFLNGKLVGIHQQYNPFIRQLREKRRKGEISQHVNIGYYHDSREIQINCDAGRATRPLFVLKNKMPLILKEDIEKLKLNKYIWSDLVQKGVIEYLDAEEEENAYIAMFEEDLSSEHTHLEISPAAILGICASIIPFPEHNQSPRNTYEAGMVKQALGLWAANMHLRLDTRGHTLHYPQQPLVKTSPMEIIGINKRPAGQNFIIKKISRRRS